MNVQSRGRGLLVLFLFTDVGDQDAPTEILVGSH
ncbi:MAG: phytanoyl-CoA dioxygenase, partial [Candidatus Rokuibacteriota bacterium]